MAGIQVEGVDNLVRTLRRAADDIEKLDDADKKAADLIVARARPRTPVRTGRLVRSLRGSLVGSRATASSNLVYANAVHWGHRAHSIEPNRFLLEAAEDSEREWTAVYDKDIQRSLDKVRGV